MLPAPTASIDSLGYDIWLKARLAITSQAYPRRISYTIGVSGLRGAQPVVDHYRALYSPSDDTIRVFSISDEQLLHPVQVPRGFNWAFYIGICSPRGGCTGPRIPLGRPQSDPDLFGVPLLAPTYMFGMRYPVAPQAAIESSDASPLRVIATVATSARRDYDVTLIDSPMLDGVATYHLALHPTRNAKTNRLRELWLDSSTYLPIRAITSGNFTQAPLVDVPWIVTFRMQDGLLYVNDEKAIGTLYMPHREVVHDATVAFQNVTDGDGKLFDLPLIEQNDIDSGLSEP